MLGDDFKVQGVGIDRNQKGHRIFIPSEHINVNQTIKIIKPLEWTSTHPKL